FTKLVMNDTASDPDEDCQINLDDAETPSDLDRIVAAALRSTSRHQAAADSADDLPMSPKVITREVIATLENSRHLGEKLAAHAWFLGLFQAEFKAFVGDGSSWIWTIFDKHFRPFKFLAVLDIIHAVTYLDAAAMADRTEAEGSPVYRLWVSWLWSGGGLASDRGSGQTTGRGRIANRRRRPDQRPPNRKRSVDVSSESTVADELSVVPQTGASDHEQPHGVGDQGTELQDEGDREILEDFAAPLRPATR
ncbi:MAG TPA: hypothetical protein PLR25_29740, partial [Planctomycetaceae bacterium]|nr:hypothetical protein [Planctomycetaceae bacterium]